MDDQFSQHHLLKRLSLIHCIFLPPLSKIRCPYVRGLISGLSILFHWSIFLSLCQYHTSGFCVLRAHPRCHRLRIPFFIKVNTTPWCVCTHIARLVSSMWSLSFVCLGDAFIFKEWPFSFLGALNVPLWPARFLLKNPVGTSRASLKQGWVSCLLLLSGASVCLRLPPWNHSMSWHRPHPAQTASDPLLPESVSVSFSRFRKLFYRYFFKLSASCSASALLVSRNVSIGPLTVSHKSLSCPSFFPFFFPG